MSLLPEPLFDGMEYIDSFGVKWVYSKASNCWKQVGPVNSIPLADQTRSGLLSKEHQFLLDQIPSKGGGFAIVVSPKLAIRSPSNPDGVLFGQIGMVSDSLKIKCVTAGGDPLGEHCVKVTFQETDAQPPGFDINFSDDFLNTFCAVVPGGPGHMGDDGEQGEQGEDGTNGGPVGLEGLAGKDAVGSYPLTGLKIIELDDIFDTAVAKLELDQSGGKLHVTKTRIKADVDEDIADQLIATPIIRLVEFGEGWDYQIKAVKGAQNDDFDVIDPTILMYPADYKPGGDRTVITPTKRNLSQYVDDLVIHYQDKLDAAAVQYDKEIEEFIKIKDKEVREAIDFLGDRLVECENITYLDYCVGVDLSTCNPNSGGGGGGGGDDDDVAPDSACGTLLTLAACPSNLGECVKITDLSINSAANPVFSFVAPPPNGNLTQLNPGTGNPTVDGAAQEAFNARMRAALAAAFVVYPKVKVPRSNAPSSDDVSREVSGVIGGASLASDIFPAGTYVFTYGGGAVRQAELTDKEIHSNTSSRDRLYKAYKEFFVGNEGSGQILNGPYSLVNPFVHGGPQFNAPLGSTEIGIEIGFAPETYQDMIPASYFDSHKWNLDSEVNVKLPNPRIDYAGLPVATINAEKSIQWVKFPIISGNHADAKDLEAAYLAAPLPERSVVVRTGSSGKFFVRCKLAYNALDYFRTMIMPPVTPQGAIKGKLPIYDFAFNRAYIEPAIVGGTFSPAPVIDVRPVGQGQIKIGVTQIVCDDESSSSDNPIAPPVPSEPPPPSTLSEDIFVTAQ